MKRTVYVAASSREIARARTVMQLLEADGVTNALDWTRVFRPIGELDHAGRRAAAEQCKAAIRRSDALLLLAPSCRSDALWEAGYVDGLNERAWERIIHIFVAGPVAARGIFAADHAEFKIDATAVDAVVRWARGEAL